MTYWEDAGRGKSVYSSSVITGRRLRWRRKSHGPGGIEPQTLLSSATDQRDTLHPLGTLPHLWGNHSSYLTGWLWGWECLSMQHILVEKPWYIRTITTSHLLLVRLTLVNPETMFTLPALCHPVPALTAIRADCLLPLLSQWVSWEVTLLL